MSAPKAKSVTNGTKKSKGPAVATDGPTDVSHKAPVVTSGRPDKAVYEAEQQRIRAEIDTVQGNLNTVKEKISLVTKGGPGNERRTTLRAELDELRSQQSGNKTSRGRIFDQMKTLQEGIQKKVKDLQNLEKQVDSGSLKLADEKRALQEITQTKRIRRTVESFQADSDAIDADRAAVEELKKQLDDPEAKAISERYDAIKAETELYANRSKLFDERTALQEQIDALLRERRESSAQFREANDRFYTKLNEDRARRAERARAQREAEEEEKRKARALQLREEASQPAFQVQIEDCQTLIDHFSGKPTTAVVSTAKLAEYTEPKLEIRQVEAAPDNFVLRKKKGEDEEAYFVGGGKAKGKGKKGGPKADGASNTEATPPPSSSSNVNVSFATLSALLSLSIPPPSSQADVPRVVEDLKTKKAWFEANQARVTSEAIAKAEAEIERLTKGKGDSLDKLPNDDPVGAHPEVPLATEITDEQPSDVVPGEPEGVQETEAS
ncbi:hypothetical protein EDB92DRAFT_2006750 [Lactarius akahatsu]|uniref:Nuclear segregation protein Bfr1 n=1 Tax=Lactarius akahatsu TaxID=416441 RepID=A0AAD4LQV3_9AGAM|nr:hypothetical protein EDB92DRAFT_2006750 [Lactarius akahatsu]